MPEQVPIETAPDERGDWIVRAARALSTLPEVSLVTARWWLHRGTNLTPDLDAPSFVLQSEIPPHLKVPSDAVQMMVMARGIAPPQSTAQSLAARAAQALADANVSAALAPEVTAFGTVAGDRHPYVVVVWRG
ncbi:MAG TPA: hypothetical protein VK797_05715 [Tepidisphaeraceae bacterium]|jgi:hypothetical protein|nr:hypothetical protein [Tepidisphaeraceae bacterium]